MTTPKKPDLDDTLDEMRGTIPVPSADLMARVLADAEALQPDIRPIVAKPSGSRGTGLWELFGGWPALSGVAAAGVAGIWLGVAPPAGLEQLTSEVFGTTTSVTLLPDYDFLVSETTDG